MSFGLRNPCSEMNQASAAVPPFRVGEWLLLKIQNCPPEVNGFDILGLQSFQFW